MAETGSGRREQPGYFVCSAKFLSGGEKDPPSHQGGLQYRRRSLRSHHGPLLGPPLVEGTKTPLENGDHIFPAMLSGIRSAQRTITFENFLFQEGEISDAFARALAERARAGDTATIRWKCGVGARERSHPFRSRPNPPSRLSSFPRCQ
jgi:phosphatidylserine/phosphatidylglycerophosphate/cardiolipin synthase-like enzyme